MVSFSTNYQPISSWLHRVFFIGVILHEITHHIILSLFDFEVTGYKLYSRNGTAEYITYQGKISIFKVICVNYAPILLLVFAIVYCLLFWSFITSTPLLTIGNLYLILSCIIYGYPSEYDVKSVKEYAQTKNITGGYPIFITVTQTLTRIYEQLLPLILLIFSSVFGYLYLLS